MSQPMTTTIALLDGDRVRAPAPGWFRRTVAADHLVAPGDVIGELEVLGRLIHKRSFPELWQVRNELTGLSQASQ